MTRTLELHHGQKGKNWEIVTSFFEPEEKIDDWFIDDLETLYTDDGFDVLVENDYEIIAHYTVQNGGNLGGVKKKLLGALEVRDDQYIDFVGYYPGGNSIER